MGQWDTAEYELRQAYSLAKKTNDTLQVATVLTNLACTAVERGSWDEAQDYSGIASKLHEALSTALDILIPLRLNEANLAFYQGKTREANSLYLEVYERAADCGHREFKTEVEACLGLTALQLRDPVSVRRWFVSSVTQLKLPCTECRNASRSSGSGRFVIDTMIRRMVRERLEPRCQRPGSY